MPTVPIIAGTVRDPDGKLYPRFKQSDDTTAILLRV